MSGPRFLLLYLIVVVGANLFLRWRFRRREEGREVYRLDSNADPYRIAFLRKGADEAVRVAIFSLVDRGLLLEQAGQLQRSRADAESFARRPIEQAILSAFTQWGKPQRAIADTAVQAALADYEHALREAQLLAGEATFAARFPSFALVLGLTLGLAGLRLANAVLHGRSNIGFLILLSMAGGIALVMAYRQRRTGRGHAALERLQRLFASLKRRAAGIAPGGASHEATVLAAVFGLGALPTSSFAFIRRLYPQAQSGDAGGGGSSDSSGCDSGGCGGGGCGGGCGG